MSWASRSRRSIRRTRSPSSAAALRVNVSPSTPVRLDQAVGDQPDDPQAHRLGLAGAGAGDDDVRAQRRGDGAGLLARSAGGPRRAGGQLGRREQRPPDDVGRRRRRRATPARSRSAAGAPAGAHVGHRPAVVLDRAAGAHRAARAVAVVDRAGRPTRPCRRPPRAPAGGPTRGRRRRRAAPAPARRSLVPPALPTCTSSAPPLGRQPVERARPRPRAGRSRAGRARAARRRGTLLAPVLRSTTTARPSVVALDAVDPAAEPGPARPRPRSRARWRPPRAGCRRASGPAGAPCPRPSRAPCGRPSRCRGRRSAAAPRAGACSASSVLRSGVVARLGHGVHQGADALRGARGVAAADVLEEPPQLAPPERLDLGRADRDRLVLGAHRTVVGERGQAPPATPGRRRGRRPAASVAEPVRRRRAQPSVGVAGSATRLPQLGDQAGERQRPAHRGERPRVVAGRAGRSRRGTGTGSAPRARWSPR